MPFSPIQDIDKGKARRSQRVKVQVGILMSGKDNTNSAISEKTQTLVVGAHGALILLTAKVSLGQLLTLRNPKTREEQACRVAYLGSPQIGKTQVGIEFAKPAPRF